MHQSPVFAVPGISSTPPLVLPAAQIPPGTPCALQVWADHDTDEDEFTLQDVNLVAIRTLHKCPLGGAANVGSGQSVASGYLRTGR